MKTILHTSGSQLADLTNELRELQDTKGRIIAQPAHALLLLKSISSELQVLATLLSLQNYADAICLDIQNWIQAGLDSVPDFSNTRSQFVLPADKAWTFFFGPYLTANAGVDRGFRCEFFLSFRDEPQVCHPLYLKYPHPKNICQSTRLLTASRGFFAGNSIVFFPENIKCNHKLERQHFALFFFNKFECIYRSITIPKVLELFGTQNAIFDGQEWLSPQLNTQEFYEARCIWGYLHDYFHHKGPRPFDEHLHLKIKWEVGLLEEIKTDCQTILTLLTDTDIAFHREIVEFIFFERLLRYPQQADAESNFDSGTGIFLLEWLLQHNALEFDLSNMKSTLDWAKIQSCLQKLVTEILATEALPENDYVTKARALVGQYLRLETSGKKYLFHNYHHQIYPPVTDRQEIDFNHVALY